MNITNKTRRIGILGGTFDPIHLGHIQPARQVFFKYSLDKLLIIPAHKPPHKSNTNTTTEHRVNMVKLICQQEANFELDTREIERTTLSYSVDTVKELKVKYPNSELFFIMGMDSLINFTSWYKWETILQCCNLIVNTRPGYDLQSINDDTKLLLANHMTPNSELIYQQKTEKPSVTTGKIYLNDCDELNISSTDIRQYLSNKNQTDKNPSSKNLPNNVSNNVPNNFTENSSQKLCLKKWLPKSIIEYINLHNLYR